MIGNCKLRIDLMREIHHHLYFQSLSGLLPFIVLIPWIALGILNLAPASRILTIEIKPLHIRFPSVKVSAVTIELF
ncbi:hypothetical protein D3C80_2081200 [compost metagenome]